MEISYDLVISIEASDDMERIRNFHENIRPGLGFIYLEDILDSIERIQQNPERYQYYKTANESIRRCVTRRFSSIILYDIDHRRNRVEILVVADSRQNWYQ